MKRLVLLLSLLFALPAAAQSYSDQAANVIKEGGGTKLTIATLADGEGLYRSGTTIDGFAFGRGLTLSAGTLTADVLGGVSDGTNRLSMTGANFSNTWLGTRVDNTKSAIGTYANAKISGNDARWWVITSKTDGTSYNPLGAGYDSVAGRSFTSVPADDFFVYDKDGINLRFHIDAVTGDIIPGNAALATNATNGFTYVETSAGTPTGVPAATATGRAPLDYDSNGRTLYINDGSWRPVTPGYLTIASDPRTSGGQAAGTGTIAYDATNYYEKVGSGVNDWKKRGVQTSAPGSNVQSVSFSVNGDLDGGWIIRGYWDNAGAGTEWMRIRFNGLSADTNQESNRNYETSGGSLTNDGQNWWEAVPAVATSGLAFFTCEIRNSRTGRYRSYECEFVTSGSTRYGGKLRGVYKDTSTNITSIELFAGTAGDIRGASSKFELTTLGNPSL